MGVSGHGLLCPTYRYGTPEEFAVMVAAIKKAGIGVLIDWVPAISCG